MFPKKLLKFFIFWWATLGWKKSLIFNSYMNSVLFSLTMNCYVYYLICICLTIILLYKGLFRISTGALRFPSIYGNSRFSKQFEITSGKKTINIRTLTAEKRYKCMIFFLALWWVWTEGNKSVNVVYARIETNPGCVTTFVDCICSCMKYTLVQNISLLFLTHNQWH